MTVSEIEARARKILLDDKEPYRWSSQDIREEIADAVRHVQSVRPETRYVNGALKDYCLPENDGDEMEMDGRFREALVYYVVYKCYLYDDTDTVNAQLADSYLAKSNTYAQI